MPAPPFPATTSVLSTRELAERVLSRYRLGTPPHCEFFTPGVNDTYRVHAGEATYFLRIYRRGWRTRPEIEAELDMLLHLDSQGFSVAAPLPRRDGRYLTRIRAVEGTRWAVLFTAADGTRVKPNDRNCTAYGTLVAQVHASLDERPRDTRRFELDLSHLVAEPLRTLEEVLEHRPADLELLERMGQELGGEIESILPRGGPEFGSCHGDHHGGNVHQTASGDLSLFDFDCYGYSWRAYDISVFRWNLSLRHGKSATGKAKATRRWNAFLRGYESIRELSDAERHATTLFVPIRHLWLMGLHVGGGDVWGRSWMQDSYFDRQMRFIRGWLERYRLFQL